MLGLALRRCWNFATERFIRVQDVQDVLQLPIVAHVPFVMLDADHRRRRRLRLIAGVAVLLLAVAGAYGFWALQLWKFVV